MDIISGNELKELVDVQTVGCICVSIYIPTFKAGRTDVQQNPVRLKKLLQKAREKLEGIGLRRPEADAYLQPAQSLLDDNAFWVDMSDGLVIFLSKDFFRYYRLPLQLPEMVVVANRFHVKPLLSVITANGRFFTLAVSQNTVRLLRCTRFTFEEMDIKGKVPRSVAEALRFEDTDREAQYHMHFGVEGIESGVVTSHGAGVEDTKDNLLRFFFLLDSSLQREFLHDETAPLVLISVDYLFPIYKKANSYRQLLNKEVEVSPDRLKPAELHQLGLSIMEPIFRKKQDEALRIYREFIGLGRTTDILDSIVTESYHGRIQTLFVADNQQRWGKYDSFSDSVEVHPEEESCDIDLLDFAAAHTLAHRGDVYVMEEDKVPGGAPVAAVLRY